MAQKRKGKNTRYQKIQAQRAALPAVPPLENDEGRRLAEQYPGNNLLKNTLKIWRDSAPRGFITYVPVLAFFLVYSVVWFLCHMLLLIPALENNMLSFIGSVASVNQVVVAVGLPFTLTILHFIYNWKKKTYYYFNAVLYILPACILYAALELATKLIPVLFYKGQGEIIKTYASDSLFLLLAGVIATFILGAVAQIVLTIRKNRDAARLTKLGLDIPPTEKKK